MCITLPHWQLVTFSIVVQQCVRRYVGEKYFGGVGDGCGEDIKKFTQFLNNFTQFLKEFHSVFRKILQNFKVNIKSIL